MGGVMLGGLCPEQGMNPGEMLPGTPGDAHPSDPHQHCLKMTKFSLRALLFFPKAMLIIAHLDSALRLKQVVGKLFLFVKKNVQIFIATCTVPSLPLEGNV